MTVQAGLCQTCNPSCWFSHTQAKYVDFLRALQSLTPSSSGKGYDEEEEDGDNWWWKSWCIAELKAFTTEIDATRSGSISQRSVGLSENYPAIILRLVLRHHADTTDDCAKCVVEIALNNSLPNYHIKTI